MSRKKKPHAANHERWLVSYADFITLLFAFFVVMFASAQVDHRKAGKLAMAIQVAFQQLGVFAAANTKPPLETSQPMPFSDVQIVENTSSTAEISRIAPKSEGTIGLANGLPNLSQLKAELEKALEPELSRNEVAIRIHGGELVISLRELGFFASGSATLLTRAQMSLARVAKILLHQPYALRVEGHTDSIPIHSARFNSNWELSTARATEIIAIFISQYGFVPERLSAAGYAEYHPVALNDSPEGRAMNRRVDIVISSVHATSSSVRDSMAIASSDSQ